jgi:hypothetical protein
MKRALVLLLSAIAVIGLGCGAPSYEKRFTGTEAAIKDQIETDHHLHPAPAEKFKDFGFFVRPPKSLPGTPQPFSLAGLPPGAFDVSGSFPGGKGSEAGSLHVLGRRKLAKKAAAKKDAAPTPEPAPRGPFDQDVQGLLASSYPAVAQTPIVTKPYQQGRNTFKRQEYKDANITVYYYSEKVGEDTYDAALIWELPAKPTGATTKGVNLTLKAFAVGPRAARAFSGEAADEGAGAAAEAGSATPS